MTKKTTKKLNTKNSKILQATMVTLRTLKQKAAIEEMAINEIQVHLLDEHGDGVILCLEYDEHGELNKTFSTMEEYYEDYEEIEVELEDDACNSPENRELKEEILRYARMDKETDLIEEAISEEYDEIFHNSRKPSSLLN